MVTLNDYEIMFTAPRRCGRTHGLLQHAQKLLDKGWFVNIVVINSTHGNDVREKLGNAEKLRILTLNDIREEHEYRKYKGIFLVDHNANVEIVKQMLLDAYERGRTDENNYRLEA